MKETVLAKFAFLLPSRSQGSILQSILAAALAFLGLSSLYIALLTSRIPRSIWILIDSATIQSELQRFGFAFLIALAITRISISAWLFLSYFTFSVLRDSGDQRLRRIAAVLLKLRRRHWMRPASIVLKAIIFSSFFFVRVVGTEGYLQFLLTIGVTFLIFLAPIIGYKFRMRAPGARRRNRTGPAIISGALIILVALVGNFALQYLSGTIAFLAIVVVLTLFSFSIFNTVLLYFIQKSGFKSTRDVLKAKPGDEMSALKAWDMLRIKTNRDIGEKLVAAITPAILATALIGVVSVSDSDFTRRLEGQFVTRQVDGREIITALLFVTSNGIIAADRALEGEQSANTYLFIPFSSMTSLTVRPSL